MSQIINKQIEELEALFAEFRTTQANPCGGSVYFDEYEEDGDTKRPWRVHFADGAEDETFRTAREAETAIRAYVEDARDEQE